MKTSPRPRCFGHASALLLAAGIMVAAPARATMTENLTLGNAYALSMGNAVTADPPGVDSVHFNPAGLARLEGQQSMIKGVTGRFAIDLDVGHYTPSREQYIEGQQAKGIFPADYFADEALDSHSTTRGLALILPGSGPTNMPVLFAPMGGVAYSRPGSNVTVGTDVYTPMLLGFYRSSDDPGRFIGQRLALTVLTVFSPSVGWRVSDHLSLGATLTVNYAGLGMNMPFRTGHIGIPLLYSLQEDACNGAQNGIACIPRDERIRFNDQLGNLSFEVEDTFAPGFNLGALWDITPHISVGAVYQSRVRTHMKGDFRWVDGDKWNQFLTAMQRLLPGFQSNGNTTGVTDGRATVDMTMPDHFAIGTRLALTQRLALNVDYKFTRWSDWQSIPVGISQPIDYLAIAERFQPDLATRQAVAFPLGLKDTWNLAAGLRFQLTPAINLRAGVENRPSSIPAAARSPLMPIGDGVLYGFGAGYAPDPYTNVDLGVGFMRTRVKMPGNTSRLGNSENPALVIYNPYQGTDITARVDVLLIEASWQRQF